MKPTLSTDSAGRDRAERGAAAPWRSLMAVLVAYVAVGWASGLLFVPPEQDATPLFPAAGIALAATVVYGRRALAAVALGSLLLQITHLRIGSAGDAMGWIVPVAAAAGAAAQAALGAWLIARIHRGQPLRLEEPSVIASSLVLGGIVAGVVGPTCATLALWATHSIVAQHALTHWLTLWGGEALGATIGLPVALTVIGRPREAWATRRMTVGLPLVLTTLLLALGIVQIGRWYDQRIVSFFERDAIALSQGAAKQLNAQLAALEAMHALYVATDEVNLSQFRRAADLWLDRLGNLRAIGWHQRVARDSLAAFESSVRGAGQPDFRILEADPTLVLGDSDAMLLRFAEPRARRALPLGLNMMSIASSRAALLGAERSGGPFASEGFKPTDAGTASGELGVVVYQVVADTTGRIRGALFIALRMEETMAVVRAAAPHYLQACLVDLGAPDAIRRLAGPERCGHRDFGGPLTHRLPVRFAGRPWELRVEANSLAEVETANSELSQDGAARLFSLSALASVAVLSALLLVITGRTRRIEMAVAERTAELQHQIAEREHTEQARGLAEAANLAKSEFLSRMSHELRTPLNAMLGFAQLLERDRATAVDPRCRQWASHIQEAGWHLLELINDVLDLSRIEAGATPVHIEAVDIEVLLAESLTLVERSAGARGITTERAGAARRDIKVLADRTRLKQVLLNLLSNAVKYNHEGGRVIVSTESEIAANGVAVLAIAVQDTGPGLCSQELAQLFRPFNRLGKEHTSIEGTGIGLVIAKMLAERQGGSLSVHSSVGVGSTFTLRMPVANEPEPAPPSELAPLDAHTYRQRQVLQIEDNEVNVELMRGILALRPQVRLRVATTLADGLRSVRASPPDLILLDLHLPDGSGVTLLHSLSGDVQTSHIPVVVVSADAMPDQLRATREAGARGYLTKPLSVDEVLAVVDGFLAQANTDFGSV